MGATWREKDAGKKVGPGVGTISHFSSTHYAVLIDQREDQTVQGSPFPTKKDGMDKSPTLENGTRPSS